MNLIKAIILPGKYKAEIKALDIKRVNKLGDSFNFDHQYTQLK